MSRYRNLSAVLFAILLMSMIACGDNDPEFVDASADVEEDTVADIDESDTGDDADDTVEAGDGVSDTDASMDDADTTDSVDDTDTEGDTEQDDADTLDTEDTVDDADGAETCDQELEWFLDQDADGFGDSESTVMACSAPDGYVADSTDCDDEDDEKWQELEGYVDQDGDGYGVGQKETVCSGDSLPDGWSDQDGDCNDNDGQRYQYLTGYSDMDGDGYTLGGPSDVCSGDTLPSGYQSSPSSTTDCNDMDANAFEMVTGYRDEDGDNYSPSGQETFCTDGSLPSDYTSSVNPGVDCNDNDADINPGKTEVCDPNNVDEDCNGDADDEDLGVAESTKTSFWADCDDDDYAASSATEQRFCDEPDPSEAPCHLSEVGGWTERDPATDADCQDRDADANPGTTTYHTDTYRAANGAQSYDYNCDGQEEQHYTKLDDMFCVCLNGGTCSYWDEPDVPSCGDSGTLVTKSGSFGSNNCSNSSSSTRTQECR